MLIDGEKWACDACVRGHRVSNCQHSDRPLQHINKKGRPVSQCPHCRGLRKSRSSHVRCECGDKSHAQSQCAHGDHKDSKDRSTCCCSHGGKCTCALKKEHHLDPVPELDADGPQPKRSKCASKPRLLTANSEGVLTVFTNGHHKPVHKNNHMAHKCGVPYKIPRANTIHGHPDLAQRSVDSLPATNTIDVRRTSSPMRDSILSAQQDVRRVRSEHGSPHASATSHLDHLRSELSPLNLSLPEFTPTSRGPLDLGRVTSHPKDSYFSPASDLDQPLFSAGLDAPSVDWSALDLDGAAYASPAFSQPPSFAGYDHPFAQSSSCAASEADADFGPLNNPSPVRPPSLVHNHLASDSSEACESENYRLSTASSFHGLPQVSMLSSNKLDMIDIEEYLNGTASAATYAGDDAKEAKRHGLGIDSLPLGESRKGGPTSSPCEEAGYAGPITADAADPYWIHAFDPSAPGQDPESEVFWNS